MDTLKKDLNQLLAHIPQIDAYVSDVSKRAVGWHIDHSLKVLYGVLDLLVKSDPKDYKWKFSPLRTVILFTGYIPRGSAKAPKQVTPQTEASKEALKSRVQQALDLLDKIPPLPTKSNFEHPYFGLLNKKQTIRFLHVHTKHHLKIIRDILKQK